jgi:hypothetical protein
MSSVVSFLVGLIPVSLQPYMVAVGTVLLACDVAIYPLLGPAIQGKLDVLKRIPVVGSIVEALEGFAALARK